MDIERHRGVVVSQPPDERTEPVDASNPLLQLGWVPREIVVNELLAFVVKFEYLLNNLVLDQQNMI